MQLIKQLLLISSFVLQVVSPATITNTSGGGGGGIAFGAVTRLAGFSNAGTISGNSPSVSGSSTLGVIKIIQSAGSASSWVTSATWNGSAMTEDTSARAFNVSAGDHLAQIFYIIAPTAGVTTIVVNNTTLNWSDIFVSCEYYTGINQSTPIDTQNTFSGSSANSISPTITTGGANEYISDVAGVTSASGAPTASPNTRTQSMSTGSSEGYAGSYLSAPTTGSQTMGWTMSGGTTWLWTAIAIKQ